MEKTACQNARVEILIANTCNCVQKKRQIINGVKNDTDNNNNSNKTTKNK